MSSKAPKQTFEPKWVQPKLGQNKQPNDFSQRSYVWSPSTSYTISSYYSSPSTSSTIASNYSSPSTSTIANNYSSSSTLSSYADQINSLCVEGNRKKLYLEKHYLIQLNKEAESRIPSLMEEISVLE
uniref:Uncharacterized protein n=1 Tax=Acrobeloides nanus TaxID=290746 RepID=A0A914DVT3_9BILA